MTVQADSKLETMAYNGAQLRNLGILRSRPNNFEKSTFSHREKFMVGRRKVNMMQMPCKYMNSINHYLYDTTSPREEVKAEPINETFETAN